MEAENSSVSKSSLEKPPNTPEMSAQNAEAMVDSMLRDSPLADPEKAKEEVPKDGGSDRLPKEGESGKLPSGGSDKQPEETPAGKLVAPYRKDISLFLFI